MRAVTVIPGSVGSSRLDEVPEPGGELGSILVEALAVGVCGTDESLGILGVLLLEPTTVVEYYRAAQVLARADPTWLERIVTRRADPTWLERIVTRRVAPEDFQDALQREPDDIKVVIEFAHP